MFSSDKLTEVHFPVTASFVSILIVAALSLIFWLATGKLSETVLFIAAAGAAVGAILGAFYAARSLALTAAALDREEERRKKTLAFQFTSKWNDPSMYHVRDVIRELFNIDHRSAAFRQGIVDGETNVFHFLNFLEETAIAMEKGGADPDILKEAYRGTVCMAWNKLQNWVGEVRQARQNSRIWINVEKLADKWS